MGPLALSSSLMNYILESSEVLNCDMMCSENENFVPVFPNAKGKCPKNPGTKLLYLDNPLTLEQVCEIHSNKGKICGFCMSLESEARSVGPFDVECTGYNGPFQPKKLGNFCPSYNTPFCLS